MVESKFRLLANDVGLLEGHKKKWLKHKCCQADRRYKFDEISHSALMVTLMKSALLSKATGPKRVAASLRTVRYSLLAVTAKL